MPTTLLRCRAIPLSLALAPRQDIDEDAGVAAVHEAFALGINLFDTSPFYGSTRSETVRASTGPNLLSTGSAAHLMFLLHCRPARPGSKHRPAQAKPALIIRVAFGADFALLLPGGGFCPLSGLN